MTFVQTAPEPEHRVMWDKGPTRRVSETRTSLTTIHGDGEIGFLGSYVCQVCLTPTVGVYIAKSGSRIAGKWVCAECLDKVTVKAKKKAVKAVNTTKEPCKVKNVAK